MMEEIIFDKDEKGEILPTIQNFYRFCGHGKLMAVRCSKCGKLLVPPRAFCPDCYCSSLRWVELRGRGKLQTFSVVHIAPKSFTVQAPYTIGIVKLEEGVSLPGRILLSKDEEPEIGMDLVVDFEEAPPEGWPRWQRYLFRSEKKSSS
jgi:uncharacterized OB-fold protein